MISNSTKYSIHVSNKIFLSFLPIQTMYVHLLIPCHELLFLSTVIPVTLYCGQWPGPFHSWSPSAPQ